MSFVDRKVFHLWMPNIFQFKGGIQVYSAFFLQALQELYPRCDYHVFLKHDTDQLPNFPFLETTKFYFAGNYPLAVKTALFAAQLFQFGLRHPSDLIISTHLNFTPVAYWLKKLTGTPYWTVAHGVDAWNIENPKIKKALHYSDRILAVSHYTRNRVLEEQNFEPSKVFVLPNTFDAGKFQIQPKPQYLLERYQLTPSQPIILTVARLDKTEQYKGYDQIIKALPKIKTQFPDIHYIIVGKGDDQSRVQELVKQLNLHAHVTLAGFIPDSELADYYNLCDVFAMPSKGEGFGIVYLEALACGKPTLGGNQDGAIDALCNGELGALVNPDDVDEIAHTLMQILSGTYPNQLLFNPQLLRQKVIETYGFEPFKAKLSQLIDSQFCDSNQHRV